VETNNKKIIDLVNNSLKGEINEESFTEIEFKVIQANQLSGLVFKSLDKEKIKEETFKKFQTDYYLYIRVDEIQTQLIEQLRMLFNQEKIPFIFLKGSFIKNLYPHTFMRSMGDIDILVKKEDMKRIHEVLENKGYRNWTNSVSHDCFVKSSVNVEVHPMLDSDIEGDFEDLFLNPWEYAVNYSEEEFHLGLEYNFFYQIYHMTKHLYRSGVGYRTLVDLYLYLKIYERDFSKDRFFEIYDKYPLKSFVNNIIYIINNLFSCKLLNEYQLNATITTEYQEKFINYIFVSGMHGTGEEFNHYMGEMANQRKKSKSILMMKFKLILTKVFPKYELMKAIYPYLIKYPFLLPFAWVSRFFKLLFTRRSKDKLKRFYAHSEEIEGVEDIFKNIGI
jgi:hypothetical protein